VKFILQVGVSLLQASTILEELHEPLFVGTHSAPLRTSLEKTQLIDQSPASMRPLEVMPPLGTVFQPFI